MIMEIIWFCTLLIVIGVAYLWGYKNGEENGLSEEALLEFEKYKYDKFYEYKRWKEERNERHDAPNA